MRLNSLQLFLVLFTLATLTTGCFQEPCYEDTNIYFQIRFRSNNSGIQQDTILGDGLLRINTYDSLSLRGIKSIKFPLNIMEPSLNLQVETHLYRYYDCDTVFDYADTIRFDSIKLDSVRIDSFFKPSNCIETVNKQRIDSILYLGLARDQIKINYAYESRLINYDCGYIILLDSLRSEIIQKQHLDTVILKTNTIDNVIEDNLYIVY